MDNKYTKWHEKVKNSKVWVADQGDGTFINPIIHADYSDPDVIRVGEDFFMVASSFNHMPGIPVLHSKDLVNWRIVNHIYDKFPMERFNKPCYGDCAWAPSIRYHDGFYWVFFGAPDEGIFMSKTKDPFGKWEPLVCVKEAKGWIDTCPFWDDDGNAYLVNAFARSRIGFKHRICISRMKTDGTALLDDGVYVYDNPEKHPTMEGPKMYKRNGYYYIFAPAGGVSTGWQTILRSKNIYGPYEDKIVLKQGPTDVNGPHQGGYVELDSGESWFIHFQDKDAYGRIIHLQPVRWVDDWPEMGVDIDGDGIGEPVSRYKKPDVGKTYSVMVPDTSDDFDGEKLGLQWQWDANPQNSWYSLEARESHLRLFPVKEGKFGLNGAPNLLQQKFPAPKFTATALLDVSGLKEGQKAGLAISGLDYSYIALVNTKEGMKLSQFTGTIREEREEQEIASTGLDLQGNIFLRVSVGEGAICSFSYSLDGEEFYPFGNEFKAHKGKWVGAKIGIFCLGDNDDSDNGYADYDFVLIEE